MFKGQGFFKSYPKVVIFSDICKYIVLTICKITGVIITWNGGFLYGRMDDVEAIQCRGRGRE